MFIGLGVDELRVNTNAIAGALYAALENGVGTQCLANFSKAKQVSTISTAAAKPKTVCR